MLLIELFRISKTWMSCTKFTSEVSKFFFFLKDRNIFNLNILYEKLLQNNQILQSYAKTEYIFRWLFFFHFIFIYLFFILANSISTYECCLYVLIEMAIYVFETMFDWRRSAPRQHTLRLDCIVQHIPHIPTKIIISTQEKINKQIRQISLTMIE